MEFSPAERFRHALQYWWFVTALVLWGGLTGYAIHMAKPPIYEARAAIIANVDYTEMGPVRELEEDQAMGIVGALIISEAVVDETAHAAREQGYMVSGEELLDMGTLERVQYQWVMRLRNTDAQKAAALANLWMDTAFTKLQEYQEHALSARSISRYLDGLLTCLQNAPMNLPAGGYCNVQTLTDLQLLIVEANAAFKTELDASKAFPAGMRISRGQAANVPKAPSLFGRNALIFSGALIGLVMAIWMYEMQIPEKLQRKRLRG